MLTLILWLVNYSYVVERVIMALHTETVDHYVLDSVRMTQNRQILNHFTKDVLTISYPRVHENLVIMASYDCI